MNIMKYYCLINNINFTPINEIDADFNFINEEQFNIFYNKFQIYHDYMSINGIKLNIKKDILLIDNETVNSENEENIDSDDDEIIDSESEENIDSDYEDNKNSLILYKKTDNTLIKPNQQKEYKNNKIVKITKLLMKELINDTNYNSVNSSELSKKIIELINIETKNKNVNNNIYNNYDNIFLFNDNTENDINKSYLYKIPKYGLFTLHTLFNLKNVNVQEIINVIEKPNVLSIDHLGQVKALTKGKTLVKLFYDNKEIIYNVEVYIPISSIKIKPTELNLTVGQKIKLNPTVEPSTEINNINFESNNKNIVLVDEKGNVNPIATGKTEIKIYSIHNNTYCICKVNVKYKVK